MPIAAQQARGLVAGRTSLRIRSDSPPASRLPHVTSRRTTAPTRQLPVLISGIGLEAPTRAAWKAAGIANADQLRRPANELIALPCVTGSMVFETVCRLVERDIWCPGKEGASRATAPDDRDLVMLRLRILDGASLGEIGTICGLSREGVRQRLHLQFGLTGEPPAAMERRRIRLTMRPELERMIALRLHNCQPGMSITHLLDGLSDGPWCMEARAAVSRMALKGFLTVEGEHVAPTAALRRMTHERASSGTLWKRRGAGPERTRW